MQDTLMVTMIVLGVAGYLIGAAITFIHGTEQYKSNGCGTLMAILWFSLIWPFQTKIR